MCLTRYFIILEKKMPSKQMQSSQSLAATTKSNLGQRRPLPTTRTSKFAVHSFCIVTRLVFRSVFCSPMHSSLQLVGTKPASDYYEIVGVVPDL